MDYFEHHYALLNDLSPEGRQRTWFDLDRLYGRWLPVERDARILDLGCGAGVLLEWLRDRRGYSRAEGLDPSASQVAFARTLGLNVTHHEHTASWLAAQEPFDLILLIDVLEHLAEGDVEPILRAAATRLRPDGRLIVRVPNANAGFAARYRYIDGTHRRSYTEVSLQAALLASGFTDISIGGDDVWSVRSLPGLFRLALRGVFRLGRRLSALGEFGPDGFRMPLSLNLLATARRRSA